MLNTLITACLITSALSLIAAVVCLTALLRADRVEYISVFEMTGPEFGETLRMFSYAFLLVAAIGAMLTVLL